MQLYFITESPRFCAEYLDNARVNKAIVESAQMLSTNIRFYAFLAGKNIDHLNLYKSTHQNHPCTQWVGKTKDNYNWTVNYFYWLLREFQKRSKYTKRHKCWSMLTSFRFGVCYIPAGDLTKFPNCAANKSLNISFKHLPVHKAYVSYMNYRWKYDKLPPKWGPYSSRKEYDET